MWVQLPDPCSSKRPPWETQPGWQVAQTTADSFPRLRALVRSLLRR